MVLLQRRHTDFQDGLLGRAKASVLALQSDLAAYARDLRRQIDDLARERDDHIGQRMHDLREERQRVLHSLESTKGPMSATFVRAALAGEEAEKAHRSIRAQVNGRPLRRGLVGVYLPLMAALALVEVPVNRLAFELFFQEQPIISLALAAVVGAVLIFFAHMIGTLVRRMDSPSRPAQQVKRGLGILLFAVLTGTMMYLLAGMRQLYVRLLEQEQGSNLSSLIEGITRGGTASTIASVASERLGLAGWTLLILNLVLFVFGATASFLRHDPHPDYEPAWRNHERARRRLTRLRTRYERAANAKQREFDEQLGSLDQLLRETQAKHDELLARETRDRAVPGRDHRPYRQHGPQPLARLPRGRDRRPSRRARSRARSMRCRRCRRTRCAGGSPKTWSRPSDPARRAARAVPADREEARWRKTIAATDAAPPSC